MHVVLLAARQLASPLPYCCRCHHCAVAIIPLVTRLFRIMSAEAKDEEEIGEEEEEEDLEKLEAEIARMEAEAARLKEKEEGGDEKKGDDKAEGSKESGTAKLSGDKSSAAQDAYV